LMGLAVCLVALVALCNALPATNTDASGAQPLDKQATPAQPPKSKMQQQLSDLQHHLTQEISDEKAAAVLRQALSESSKTALHGELLRTQRMLEFYGLVSRLCQAHTVDLLAAINATGRDIGEATVRKHVRSDQLLTVATVFEDMSATATNASDMIRNIDSDLRRELSTPNYARGNGMTFDKFVIHPPKAVIALQDLLSKTEKLNLLLQGKIDHDHQTQARLRGALTCPDCEVAVSAVRNIDTELRVAVTKQRAECEVVGGDDLVMHNAISHVQQQLQSAADDDALQTRESIRRHEQTTQQLKQVADMLRNI